MALLFARPGALTADERPAVPRAGLLYQSAETQALQADESRNPGMLWVEQGARIWEQSVGTTGRSCAACHGAAEASMVGTAARHPRLDPASASVETLELRINDCRVRRQGAAKLAFESPELLALTAYVAYQSRGLPRTLPAHPANRTQLDAGLRLFRARQGQLNIACSQCHDDLAGKKLRGDTISQGQTHGWPAYRLEWQTLGSLQRRLRACSLGVRAEVLAFGHPDYLALEFYLSWRGENLPMESPGVRR